MSKTSKNFWMTASAGLFACSIALTAFFGKTLLWTAVVSMNLAALVALVRFSKEKGKRAIVRGLVFIGGVVFLGITTDWDFSAFLNTEKMPLSVLVSLLVFMILTVLHLAFFYLLRKNNRFAIRTSLISLRKLLEECFISINEEAWFRGAILLSLAASFDAITATLTSSALFSLVHLKSSPHSVITALLMGLAFSAIMLSTQNILGPVCGHFLFNMVNSVLIGPPVQKKFNQSLPSL